MPLQTRDIHLLTTPDRMEIFVRGERFATYRYSEGQPPGFVSLAAPGERLVTQPNADGLGLWLAHDALAAGVRSQESGGREEAEAIHNRQSTIVNVDMVARRGTYSVGFQHECAWLDAEGAQVLTDTRLVRVAPGPSEGAILDIHLRLQAPENRAVVFGGGENPLLCLRAASALFDSEAEWAGGGQARNSLGEYGMANLHGRRANWCACVGVVRGETVGFAFLEHPDNPTFPSPWIARPDGLLSPSPFAWHSLTLAPNESLNLRCRLLVYLGYVNQGWADERLTEFARES